MNLLNVNSVDPHQTPHFASALFAYALLSIVTTPCFFFVWKGGRGGGGEAAPH